MVESSGVRSNTNSKKGSSDSSHGDSSSEKVVKKAYIMPAPIMKRVFAFFVDMMILNIFVLSPFNSLISSAMEGDGLNNMYRDVIANPELMSSLTYALVAATIIVLFYFIVMQRKFGQTLGMMILDIYAIKLPKLPKLANKNGAARRKKSVAEMVEMGKNMKLGFVDALLRNLFLVPFFPFIFLWIFDPLYLFLSKSSQRLMEYASSTMTVTITAYDNDSLTHKRWI